MSFLDKSTPITPDQLFSTKASTIAFPPLLLQAINELLLDNYNGRRPISISLKKEVIITRFFELQGGETPVSRRDLFDKHYMDFEPLFRKHGWKVKYASPDRDESFDEFYKFEATVPDISQ